MGAMFEKHQQQLNKRKEENNHRTLSLDEGLVDFCSNDYLGISKELKSEGNESVGSTGSRLLRGNYSLIEQLEGKLADFHQVPSALVYNSGYVANLGIFSAIPQKGDAVLYDEFIHASAKDGMRLSFAKTYSFKHNDLESLKNRISTLRKSIHGDLYVAVESVYSMDGDAAPLRDLVDLSRSLNFVLIVDEAHALGIYGKQGEGLVQALGLGDYVGIRVVTFGKSLGCHGAAVLCNDILKEYLINFSRPFIYSTALPPHAAKIIIKAYSVLGNGSQVALLTDHIQLFKSKAAFLQLSDLIPSDSAIQCFLMPGNDLVKKCSDLLGEAGFDVRAILCPTVPKGSERLRICLHAFNTKEQIHDLLVAISDIQRTL